MAGYKKQSKKTPLKKYGRRRIQKLDVSTQKDTYASNAKAQGSVGRAVGAIGTRIGQAVDEAAGKKKKKTTSPGGSIKSVGLGGEAAKHSGLGGGQAYKGAFAIPSRELNLPGGDTSVPTLDGGLVAEGRANRPAPTPAQNVTPAVNQTKVTPTPVQQDPFLFGQADAAFQGNSQPRGDWQGPLVHPTGPVHHVDQGTLASEQSPAPQPMSWYNPQHPGSGNVVNAQGADSQASSIFGRSPGIAKEYAKKHHRKNPYGKSPMKRYNESPFKREQEEFSPAAEGLSGGKHIPQMERAQALSYLGEEGAAAAEGYNMAIDRHNYKQKVWAAKQADIEDAYGKLVVPPSGQTAWDAQTKNLATEWKKEYTELYNNKDQYDPAEYTNKLEEIRGRATQFQQASNNLQQIVADYDSNLDNVSASTPAETIDILETLRKDTGTLAPVNVNGVPTLQGVTIGGKEVSVPISELANGKNLWKFNTKVDVQPGLNAITTKLNKFRTEVASAGGIDQRSIGWDKLQGTAEAELDSLLQNPKQVEAIAAEKFNIDNDDWKMIEDVGYYLSDDNEVINVPGNDPTEFVRQKLMSEVKNQFQPYEQLVSGTKADPRATAARQNRQLDQAQQRIDASQVEKPTISDNVTQAFTDVNSPKFTQMQGQLASRGYKVFVKDGQIALVKNFNKPGKEEVISRGDEAKASISKLLGGNFKDAPLNRSPFRRVMDFFTSPFKKDPDQKLDKAKYERALKAGLTEKAARAYGFGVSAEAAVDQHGSTGRSYQGVNQNEAAKQRYRDRKGKSDNPRSYKYKTDLSDKEIRDIEKREHGRPGGLYDAFVDASERDRYDNAKLAQKIKRGDNEWLGSEDYHRFGGFDDLTEYVTGKLNPVDNALGWAGQQLGYGRNRFTDKVARDEANYEVRKQRQKDLDKYYSNLSKWGKDTYNKAYEYEAARDEAESEPPLW